MQVGADRTCPQTRSGRGWGRCCPTAGSGPRGRPRWLPSGWRRHRAKCHSTCWLRWVNRRPDRRLLQGSGRVESSLEKGCPVCGSPERLRPRVESAREMWLPVWIVRTGFPDSDRTSGSRVLAVSFISILLEGTTCERSVGTTRGKHGLTPCDARCEDWCVPRRPECNQEPRTQLAGLTKRQWSSLIQDRR